MPSELKKACKSLKLSMNSVTEWLVLTTVEPHQQAESVWVTAAYEDGSQRIPPTALSLSPSRSDAEMDMI